MDTPLAPPARAADPRPRILAFGVRRLKSLLQELAPHYAAQAVVEVIDKGFEEALAELQRRGRTPTFTRGAGAAAGHADVLVAAGSNGAFLRQHADLPVALVKVSGFDVMRSLAHARRLASRVALVTYQSPLQEWQHFDAVFGLGVEHRAYRDEEEARLIVGELKEQGVRAVVAPGLVADLADEAGLQGIFLYSRDAVREALDDAVEIARARRIEAARRERLNTILAQLREGVVAVDMDERIEILNPAMEALLGAEAGSLLGRRLSEVAPELGLKQTLREARAELEQIQRHARRVLVTTRLPIVEQGVQTGAVLACQDPAAIQRVERHLRTRLRQEQQGGRLRGAGPTRYTLEDLVGSSETIARTRERALRCAASDATVLIVGESGTGKELLAQGIHHASRRAQQPFVAVNCGAFPESLLESELFGHEEGAFTGSRRGGKAGLFEAAHTGTLFLDEIGEMPPALQTRLLRVLQEREILRIGATEPTPIDVRVIAATHRELGAAPGSSAALSSGPTAFRRDLYYRLNILRVELPALRDRLSDLPELAQHLLAKVAGRMGVRADAAQELVAALADLGRGYGWPGNVRELENLIERALAYGPAPGSAPASGPAHTEATPTGLRERAAAIAPELLGPGGPAARALPPHDGGSEGHARAAAVLPPTLPGMLRNAGREAELRAVLQVLADCQGRRAEACRRLGIGRTTLWRRLQEAQDAGLALPPGTASD